MPALRAARRDVRHADAGTASCAAASASLEAAAPARRRRARERAAPPRSATRAFRRCAAASSTRRRVEVSLLSAAEPLDVRRRGRPARAAAARRRRPDPRVRPPARDLPAAGLGIAPRAARFLAALKRKAGLPADFWSPQLNVSRYAVTKWTESEFLLSEAAAMSNFPGRWWHALDDGRIQCDLCPRDCRLHEGQRGAVLRAPARRRRDGAHHLRPLVGLLHRPDREEAAQPLLSRARACSRSAPPAATSPASSARTGTSRSRARWTR